MVRNTSDWFGDREAVRACKSLQEPVRGCKMSGGDGAALEAWRGRGVYVPLWTRDTCDKPGKHGVF